MCISPKNNLNIIFLNKIKVFFLKTCYVKINLTLYNNMKILRKNYNYIKYNI